MMSMGLVKYNLKNFDDCINKVQTSKRYIKSAENIIEAIYGPLDWKLAIQTGKTYCKILDSIIDINEDDETENHEHTQRGTE